MIAVSDRAQHRITDMPALFNIEFRNSFKTKRGTLALENNVDLRAAAGIAEAEFSEFIGPGHPLRGALESTTVVTDADADVGDTHVSESSGTTTVADVSMSPDLNDRSETASAGRPLLEFGPRGPGVRDTSASAGSAGAGNRDNTPDAHHCPYSDIRLSNRASHGDADAAAVGSSMRPGWSEPFHPKAGVPGGFALPPGATGAAAAIFGEWPGGSAAGPALAPAASSDLCQCAECTAEAAHRAESEAGMHTWLANNLPPAQTPQPWGESSSRSWQGWSSWEWRDDATRRQRPARHERGTAPYSKGKGKKGKKGHDPAS